MKIFKSVAVMVLAGIGGCATDRVSESEPSAELTMHRYDLGGISNTQFWTCSDGVCVDDKTKDRLFVFSWATANEKTIKIPVAKPFPLFGLSGRIEGAKPSNVPGVFQFTGTSCADLVQFVPQADAKYDVVQSPVGLECPVVIRNAKSGAIEPAKPLPIEGSVFGLKPPNKE